MRHTITIKRAYEAPADADGTRVLVDRLWPRGLTRAAAAIDVWAKEVSPSPDLRKWFGHDPAKWDEFRRRYAAELRGQPAPLEQLRKLAAAGPVTLVYAARNEVHNGAIVLRDLLRGG